MPNKESLWVDDRLASLAPSSEWHPNSSGAYERLLERRKTEPSPLWIRLPMTTAILASIGLVAALLPWHALWKPAAKAKASIPEFEKAATPAAMPVPVPLIKLTPPPEPPPSVLPAIAEVPQAPAPEQEQKPAERGTGATAPHTIVLVEPKYTDEARQAHIQGKVVMDVTIRADGTAKVNKIISGLGYGLDESAIAAMEQSKFTPGTMDGKPVDFQLQTSTGFHLY